MGRHVRVAAVRVGGKQLALRCPFCGELHYHGACGPEFGRGNGSRVPHCVRGRGTEIGYSYELRETQPRLYLARLLRRAGFRGSQVTELLDAAAVPVRGSPVR